jgi:hypothetical protein
MEYEFPNFLRNQSLVFYSECLLITVDSLDSIEASHGPCDASIHG